MHTESESIGEVMRETVLLASSLRDFCRQKVRETLPFCSWLFTDLTTLISQGDSPFTRYLLALSALCCGLCSFPGMKCRSHIFLPGLAQRPPLGSLPCCLLLEFVTPHCPQALKSHSAYYHGEQFSSLTQQTVSSLITGLVLTNVCSSSS